MSAYTSGDWHVKPGNEEAFVEAWKRLARESALEVDATAWAKLLRDNDDPRHFVSFGRWSDEETVAEWSASDGFKQRFGSMKELVESAETRTFSVAAEAGMLVAAT